MNDKINTVGYITDEELNAQKHFDTWARRELLKHDLGTIVASNFNECSELDKQSAFRMLCDAVVKNFCTRN